LVATPSEATTTPMPNAGDATSPAQPADDAKPSPTPRGDSSLTVFILCAAVLAGVVGVVGWALVQGRKMLLVCDGPDRW
jgi:hypothetical protein